MVELCRRLPEDIPYLVAQAAQRWRSLPNPGEVALGAMLLLLGLAWFSQKMHVIKFLNLRQQLYGRDVQEAVSSVMPHERPNPYAFLHRWPHQRDISAETPEKCSFRLQAKMRKQRNHLTMRLGMGLPDVKRRADLGGRIGIDLVGKEQPHTEFEYMARASLSFRGLPRADQAHLDEYFMLSGILNKCSHLFGTLHAVGDGEGHVSSSRPGWSEMFDGIHQRETEDARVVEDAAHVRHLHKLGYKHLPIPGKCVCRCVSSPFPSALSGFVSDCQVVMHGCTVMTACF